MDKTLSNSGIVNLSRKDYMEAVEKLANNYNGSVSFANIEFTSLYGNKYVLLKYSDGELKRVSTEKMESAYEYIILYDEKDDEIFVGYMCATSFRSRKISLDIMLKVKSISEAIRIIKCDLIGNDINKTLDEVLFNSRDDEEVIISNSGDAFDAYNELLEC